MHTEPKKTAKDQQRHFGVAVSQNSLNTGSVKLCGKYLADEDEEKEIALSDPSAVEFDLPSEEVTIARFGQMSHEYKENFSNMTSIENQS